MRILVTGGAGFIGSALVRRLAADGHDVVAFDNFSRGKAERVMPVERVRCWPGDIRSKHEVGRAMFGCDVVFHLAYLQGTQTFYSNPEQVIEVALKGITNVLDAAAVQGGKELILLSSSEVYQMADQYPTPETVPLSVPDVTNPRYSYGAGKIASEVAALAYSDRLRKVVIARPHNIYGPDMGWEHVIPEVIKRMVKTPVVKGAKAYFLIQGTGQETRSFCYIHDCIEALVRLMHAGQHRGVYHVGTEDEITILRVVEKIASLMERDTSIIVKASDLPKGSPTRRCPSTTRLRALGYSPKVNLDDGLEKTVEWYRAHV